MDDWFNERKNAVKTFRPGFYFTSLFCFLAFALFGWFVVGGFSPAPESKGEFASTAKEDLSCNCVLKSGEQFSELAYETPEECGPERNYYEAGIKKFKALDKNGYFSGTRDLRRTAQIIPRKCFLYSMKYTLPPQFKSPEFAVCDGKPTKKGVADFTRTNYKACMTEDMINIVYNSYLDAVDCLDVPPKFAVAKFMNESGVTPNIIASNNDAGLSQFSNGAMATLKRLYPQWSRQIFNSNKASCKRLLSYPGAVPRSQSEVIDDPAKKCHLVDIPANPMKNFVYYGIYYHITKKDSDFEFNKSVRYLKKTSTETVIDKNWVSTAELLKQARMESFDIENIRETVAVMAYNTGPVAATYFREWLKYRNTKFPTVPIREADLNMTISNPWADNSKDTLDQVKAKFNIDDKKPMKFWEWMIVSTKSRFRYASYVKFYANRLDRIFGAGVCTEDNFLE